MKSFKRLKKDLESGPANFIQAYDEEDINQVTGHLRPADIEAAEYLMRQAAHISLNLQSSGFPHAKTIPLRCLLITSAFPFIHISTEWYLICQGHMVFGLTEKLG